MAHAKIDFFVSCLMEAHYPENHALASIDPIESSPNILHFCRIQEAGTGNTEKIVFPAAKAHMDSKKESND